MIFYDCNFLPIIQEQHSLTSFFCFRSFIYTHIFFSYVYIYIYHMQV